MTREELLKLCGLDKLPTVPDPDLAIVTMDELQRLYAIRDDVLALIQQHQEINKTDGGICLAGVFGGAAVFLSANPDAADREMLIRTSIEEFPGMVQSCIEKRRAAQ